MKSTGSPRQAVQASLGSPFVIAEMGRDSPQLVEAERVLPEVFKRHDVQGRSMSGLEDDLWGRVGIESFLPAAGTQAPAITRSQTLKAVLGHGGAEVIASRPGESQEFCGHDDANGVKTNILPPGVATAVTVEAGDRLGGAGLEHATQDIDGWCPARTAFLGRLVEHGALYHLEIALSTRPKR